MDPAAPAHAVPPLAEVAGKSVLFATQYNPPLGAPLVGGRSGTAIDLSDPTMRAALLRWLNSWGCRLPYSRPGEVDRFDASVATWWADCGRRLPATRLAHLSDAEIDYVATAFDALSAAVLGGADRPRRLGPTAAAKALYALRPDTVVPWDAAIATALHGARDGAAFGRHQRLSRRWMRSLLAEAAIDDLGLAAAIGRPGTPLPKILDDYWYLTHTVQV